jgi:hypothetical protein
MYPIKFRAGRALPNLKSVFQSIRAFRRHRKVKVTVTFDGSIVGAMTGSTNWLKIGGYKSGWLTRTNNEELIAIRVLPSGIVELCNYKRRCEKLSFNNIHSMRVPDKVVSVSFILERPINSAMRFVAWGWNEGGGEYSLGDWMVFVSVKAIKG